VGVLKTSLVMGKHSGRHAFREKLKELGYELGENALEDAFKRFKDLADRKKHVYDEDIEALADDEIDNADDHIKLVSLTIVAGTQGPQLATMTLDVEGQHKTVQASGTGPVDACFKAIHAIIPHEAKLELYQVHAVTEGTDAQAEVSVRISDAEGRVVNARAADPDTLVASTRSYLAALNKLHSRAARMGGAAARIHSTSPLGGV
jgi:2-isopropylmalate synthase